MKKEHIHILGICGTFMGGIAIIAKQMGYHVTGSDTNTYPPMSTFLLENGIDIIPNFDTAQLHPTPDKVIIGNAMKRGNPCIEYILQHKLPYISGPQWLHDHLLVNRWVLAISGTHGKTTTTSMLTWILEKNSLSPGFLIGGIASNFGVSARLGNGQFFVIEADEYDTAFFDKRSKFLHYNPTTLVINNLGFDHADIFENMQAIEKQFHHLIRTIPNNGLILSTANEHTVENVLNMGCWSETQFIGEHHDWYAKALINDCTRFAVYHQKCLAGEVSWNIFGQHNMHNALMSIAAAFHIGISIENACRALSSFINPKRRLEVKGNINNITVYDDFAHHPAEILATLSALRSKIGDNARILAVLEPRSNTMKMGIYKEKIPTALTQANLVFLLQPNQMSWRVEEIANQCKQPAHWSTNTPSLVDQIIEHTQQGDHILIMSNGSFDNIHQQLLNRLNQIS